MDEVVQGGRAAVGPVLDVVSFSPVAEALAAGEGTSLIADHKLGVLVDLVTL